MVLDQLPHEAGAAAQIHHVQRAAKQRFHLGIQGLRCLVGEFVDKVGFEIIRITVEQAGDIILGCRGRQRFTGKGGKGIGHRLAISRIALERQTIEGDGLVRPLA